MKRGRVILGLAAVAGVIALIVLNALTGLVTAAPPLDFEALAGLHPGVRVQINTALIERQILEEVRDSGQVPVPRFLVRAMLPHGFSAWFAPDFDRNSIEMRALLQEKRGGPLIARLLNRRGVLAEIEQFAFDVEGFRAPQRGAVTVDGWYPLEKNAGDELFSEFTETPALELRPMDGDHLIELRAENRNGGAYLVFASLLYAFEIDLDEQEEQLSLTSFQFVEQIALTADVVLGDSVGFVCEMDIEPGQRNKIAIVNLKAGLQELLERVGGDLKKNHGLVLSGQSEWRGDTLVFTYRLDDVPGLLKMLRDSERFD